MDHLLSLSLLYMQPAFPFVFTNIAVATVVVKAWKSNRRVFMYFQLSLM